jgi:hypothetical protein
VAVANVGTLETSRTLVAIVNVTALVALVTTVVINVHRFMCRVSVIYYLFEPTNAYIYIYIYVYIYIIILQTLHHVLRFSDFDQIGNISKHFSKHSQYKISQKFVWWESRYSTRIDAQTDS